MPIVVEDGTCVAGANAFVSRQEFIDFGALYYPATTIPDTEASDGAIVRTSLWLSSYPIWNGAKVCDCVNILAWPRSGVVDCDGCTFDSDSIPEIIKQVTYIGSLAELVSPGALTPTITAGLQVKREKVDVIEVEYMTPSDQNLYKGQNPLVSLRPVLTQATDLLRCMASFPGNAVPWPWVA